MSATKGNDDCTLYHFPVSNDDESYTLDEQCRNAYCRNLSLGTCTPSSVDFDVLLRDVNFAEISPGQRDDSLHARKSSHAKRISECYPHPDFETKRNCYVSIDESVTKLKQALEDDTLSGNNNAKRQKLERTTTSTEQRYDTKIITRVSPPFLEITCSKEEHYAHDASNRNQHYNQTMPLYSYLSSDQDQKKPQQQEYLSGTLNFPYKDFTKKNQGVHFQVWHDEEEQSRLEKYFNPKWQVEFFSKFYAAGESLETPDIFGSKASKKMSKNSNVLPDENHAPIDDTSDVNFEQHFAQNEDENALFMPIISDPIENYFDVNSSSSAACPTPTSDTSYCSIQEAAVKLCTAMDDTDKTRDTIALIEQYLSINRDELLKGKYIVKILI